MVVGGVSHRAGVAANHLAVVDMLRAEVGLDKPVEPQVAVGLFPQRDGYFPLASSPASGSVSRAQACLQMKWRCYSSFLVAHLRPLSSAQPSPACLKARHRVESLRQAPRLSCARSMAVLICYRCARSPSRSLLRLILSFPQERPVELKVLDFAIQCLSQS
jgi:hypothetical protein